LFHLGFLSSPTGAQHACRITSRRWQQRLHGWGGTTRRRLEGPGLRLDDGRERGGWKVAVRRARYLVVWYVVVRSVVCGAWCGTETGYVVSIS